jgi:hypothetical protein
MSNLGNGDEQAFSHHKAIILCFLLSYFKATILTRNMIPNPLYYEQMKSGLVMALQKGEKLFTETGTVTFDALQPGVPTNVTFTSKVEGVDNKFQSGDDRGEGTITLHANRILLARYKCSLAGPGCESHERSKVDSGNKARGDEIVTGRFDRPIIMETEMDLSGTNKGKFTNTGYELK